MTDSHNSLLVNPQLIEEILLETANVKRLFLATNLLSLSRCRKPTMAVITANSGQGKTSAIRMYMIRQTPNSLTGLPDVIAISVDNKSTARNLAVQIMRELDERPRGRNANEITHEAAAALVRNGVWLLIVDEADALNDEGFEVLRHLHDRTGCCVLLVGIPHILALIDRQEKFSSRVTIRIAFLPLTKKEVIYEILPRLSFQKWQFDPTDATDCAMGEYIWRTVHSSFRRLTHWLQQAEMIAQQTEGCTRIDRKILDKARTFQEPEFGKKAKTRKAEPNSPEEESERRHAANTKKR